MSNPWSGMLAKSINSKKRSRTFWNMFFSLGIIIILTCMSVFVYQIMCDYSNYESEQIFIEYKDGHLVTDACSYEIPKVEKQEINIRELIETVKNGEKITLSISKISGEVLEVKYLSKEVYKKERTPIIPTVVACVLLILPILSFFIFMLVVTNIKKPGKRIDKLQKKFLLRFYK